MSGRLLIGTQTTYSLVVEDLMTDAMRKVDLLRAACCVAGADGEVSPDELRFVKRLADEAGVGAASLEAMIDRAQTDEAYHADQFRVLEFDAKETMQLLFRAAVVDGELRSNEAKVLQRLSRRLGVPAERFDSWLKQTVAYLKKKSSRNAK